MIKHFTKFLLLFVLLFSPQVFGNETEFGVFNDGKTIADLKEDIKQIELDLDKNDTELKATLRNYNIDSFLRTDLTFSEREIVIKIATDFRNFSNKIEAQIASSTNIEEIKKLQNDLIEHRKVLYTGFTPYIKADSYKNYLTYVEINIKSLIEKNNLALQNIKLQKNIEEKSDILKQQIEANNQNINKEIKNLVDQKLEEKFEILIKSEAFNKTSREGKIKAIQNFIAKLNAKIAELSSNSSLNAKTIEIYKISVARFNEFLRGL